MSDSGSAEEDGAGSGGNTVKDTHCERPAFACRKLCTGRLLILVVRALLTGHALYTDERK